MEACFWGGCVGGGVPDVCGRVGGNFVVAASSPVSGLGFGAVVPGSFVKIIQKLKKGILFGLLGFDRELLPCKHHKILTNETYNSLLNRIDPANKTFHPRKDCRSVPAPVQF